MARILRILGSGGFVGVGMLNAGIYPEYLHRTTLPEARICRRISLEVIELRGSGSGRELSGNFDPKSFPSAHDSLSGQCCVFE